MSSLMERMMKVGSIKEASVLSESTFFNNRDVIPTELPILNIAFSGSVDGGLISGLTTIAGESKSFKTMLSLYCMKAYLNKHSDGIAILYDSEFGITEEYLKSFDIDTSRVYHIPLTDVEELKFDMVSRLEEITKKDNVFFMIDSIGNLASKKEVEDAQNAKSVADMSRAKGIKSLWRIVTPHLTKKDIPCVTINHIYKTQELYAKNVVSGGTGNIYSSNQIFIITKAQEKDGNDLKGWKFTINIEKSRFVREKSKMSFVVTYEGGIQKWDAIFDMALDSGFIIKPKVGWYQTVDPETGEISEKNYRKDDVLGMDTYFESLIKNEEFKKYIEKSFKLSMDTFSHAPDENDIDIDSDEEVG